MLSIKTSTEQYMKLPAVPSWLISVNDGGTTIHIADVSDEQLQMIGEEWTKALIRKAECRRKWKQGDEPLKPCPTP